MRLSRLLRDERPALAMAAVVGAGLLTFAGAVGLLGGSGIADPGTDVAWAHQLRTSNTRSGVRTPPPQLQLSPQGLLVSAGRSVTLVGTDGGELGWTRSGFAPSQDPFGEIAWVVTDHHLLIPGGAGVTMVDLAAGGTIWEREVAVSGLAAFGPDVFVLSGGFDADGLTGTAPDELRLTAHDVTTGEVGWEATVTEENVTSAYVVATERGLFVTVHEVELDLESGVEVSLGSRVLSLDPGTGAERWSREIEFAGALAGAVGAEPLVVLTERGLTAFDPSSGQPVWEWSEPEGHPHDLVVGDGLAVTVLDTSDAVTRFDEPPQVPVVIDLDSGHEVWRGAPMFQFRYELAGDRIVIAAPHGPVLSEGTGGQADLSVIELDSGNAVWERSFPTETDWEPLGLAPDEQQLFVSESNGAVHALSWEDGETLWSVDPSGSSAADDAPLVSDDAVFLLAGDGALRAFDVAEGDQRWATLHSTTGASQPTVAGEHVYAATGLGIVRAYSRATGEVTWETESRHAVIEDPGPRPALAGGAVVVADPDGTLLALEAGNGQERWTRPAEGVIGLAGHADTVLVAHADGRLSSLDAASGDERWGVELEPLRGGPSLAGTTVLLTTGDGRLEAVAASTGDTLWSYDSGVALLPTPAVDATAVYVLAGPRLIALARTSGEVLWEEVSEDATYVGAPTLSQGQVFVAATDLSVRVLSASSGEEIDRIDVAAPIRSVSAGADGLLVAMTADGELRAYR